MSKATYELTCVKVVIMNGNSCAVHVSVKKIVKTVACREMSVLVDARLQNKEVYLFK